MRADGGTRAEYEAAGRNGRTQRTRLMHGDFAQWRAGGEYAYMNRKGMGATPK